MGTGPIYGHIKGTGHGNRQTIASGEYFSAKGGRFVYMNAGSAYLIDATTYEIAGWADAGKVEGYTEAYFLSDSNSDALIMNGAEDVFRMPGSTAVTTSDIGKTYDLTISGSTVTTIQQVNNDGTTVSGGQVVVVAVDAEDVSEQTLQVRIA